MLPLRRRNAIRNRNRNRKFGAESPSESVILHMQTAAQSLWSFLPVWLSDLASLGVLIAVRRAFREIRSAIEEPTLLGESQHDFVGHLCLLEPSPDSKYNVPSLGRGQLR
jgi:hypothetical protein